MERDIDVRTAEAVAVRYELAGLGSRFLALATDLALQALAVVVVLLGLLVIGLIAGHPAAPGSQTAKFGSAMFIALGAVAGFVLFFGYFIVFELLWDGQSPGKRLLGLRVMRDGGFPIDAGASVIRNLTRVIETALGFYVLSGFVMLLSPENKRLGDFAAGTVVVRDRPDDLPVLGAVPFDEPEYNDGLDADDHALIARFLARRATLEPRAAGEIAARIAERVRPKLRASFHFLSDVDLLEHVMGSRSRGTG